MKQLGFGLLTVDGVPMGLWPRPLSDAKEARTKYLDKGFAVDIVPVYVGAPVTITAEPTREKKT